MNNLILLLAITVLTLNTASAQKNWEHLGTIELAEIVKIVNDNGRYYALTDNGIYYTEANENNWKLIEGTAKQVGFDGFAVTDFYISNDNIYLIYMDDTIRRYIYVSNDFGNTWKSILNGLDDIANVKLVGDTIQFSSRRSIYYSDDAFRTYEIGTLPSSTILANDIDIFNPNYMVDNSGSLHTIENFSGYLHDGPKLLDLPDNYEFIQFFHADSLVFVWATDKKDFVLFKVNPVSGDISKSLVFDYKWYINYHSNFTSSSTYFKYENNSISMVTHKYGSESIYISNDLGVNWQTSKSLPQSYKEYFGDTLFINYNNNLYVSTDNGETLIPHGKGILSHFNVKIRSERSDVYLEVNDYSNPAYYKKIPNENGFINEEFLKGYNWVLDSDQKIYTVKDNKLWRWDEESETFKDNFDINKTDTIWNVFIANDVLVVTAKNGLKYSFDKGQNWVDTHEKVIIYQLVFYKGYYFIHGDTKIFKSQDFKTWTPVEVIGSWGQNVGFLWVISDELYLQPEYSFMYGKYNESGDYFDIKMDLPFYYNMHSSDYNSGIAMIDKLRMVAFNKNQGIKYSVDGGYWWQEIEEFVNTKIYDVKVIDDHIYVLDMYGLWKRPVDFLTSTIDSKHVKNNSKFVLNPNPTSGTFKIVMPNPFTSGTIQIIDEEGRSVYTNSDSKDTFDISHLKNGIYFVIIETKDGLDVKKIIKVE